MNFGRDHSKQRLRSPIVKDDQFKFKVLIGYLWYFMTTYMGYDNSGEDILKNMMMDIVYQNSKDPEAPQRDPNGVAKAKPLVKLIWTDIYKIKGAPNPIRKPTWKKAWAEFIKALPVETEIKKEMKDDLHVFDNYKKYVEYIEYLVEINTEWHPTIKIYTALLPLLTSVPG